MFGVALAREGVLEPLVARRGDDRQDAVGEDQLFGFSQVRREGLFLPAETLEQGRDRPRRRVRGGGVRGIGRSAICFRRPGGFRLLPRPERWSTPGLSSRGRPSTVAAAHAFASRPNAGDPNRSVPLPASSSSMRSNLGSSAARSQATSTASEPLSLRRTVASLSSNK